MEGGAAGGAGGVAAGAAAGAATSPFRERGGGGSGAEMGVSVMSGVELSGVESGSIPCDKTPRRSPLRVSGEGAQQAEGRQPGDALERSAAAMPVAVATPLPAVLIAQAEPLKQIEKDTH